MAYDKAISSKLSSILRYHIKDYGLMNDEQGYVSFQELREKCFRAADYGKVEEAARNSKYKHTRLSRFLLNEDGTMIRARFKVLASSLNPMSSQQLTSAENAASCSVSGSVLCLSSSSSQQFPSSPISCQEQGSLQVTLPSTSLCQENACSLKSLCTFSSSLQQSTMAGNVAHSAVASPVQGMTSSSSQQFTSLVSSSQGHQQWQEAWSSQGSFTTVPDSSSSSHSHTHATIIHVRAKEILHNAQLLLGFLQAALTWFTRQEYPPSVGRLKQFVAEHRIPSTWLSDSSDTAVSDTPDRRTCLRSIASEYLKFKHVLMYMEDLDRYDQCALLTAVDEDGKLQGWYHFHVDEYVAEWEICRDKWRDSWQLSWAEVEGLFDVGQKEFLPPVPMHGRTQTSSGSWA